METFFRLNLWSDEAKEFPERFINLIGVKW